MHDLDSELSPVCICIAEDRKSCESSLKLLLICLCRFNASVPVVLYYPPADRDFLTWVTGLGFRHLSVRTSRVADTNSWNVKPQVLLELLSEIDARVVWIDSDILTTKSIMPTFEALDHRSLVVAEEALLGHNDNNGLRARMWRFDVGRYFSFPLNTCVLSVTRDHVPLLERWRDFLQSADYKEAQQRPLKERPIHMFGDQDVLTALLCSSEFCTIDVRVLRRGHDIIQWYERYGFTVVERFLCLSRGMPSFIHQQGWKPWLNGSEPMLMGIRGKLVSAYQDLSPYTTSATKISPLLTSSWARPRSRLSAILRKFGFGSPPLVGLPIALVFDFERLMKLPRSIVKAFLDRFYPDALFRYRSRRWAKEMREHFRETFLERQTKMKLRIYGSETPHVLTGPFEGMKYLDEIVWGPIESKWLGTYEQELHPIIKLILNANYSTLMDIGSAEGYYAIGLAAKLPNARVYSFDIDPWARRQQRNLAKLNGIKNIKIRGQCKPHNFVAGKGSRALIICDIEGSEYNLLDPQKTPSLCCNDLLIELHDHLESGLTAHTGAEEMARRFENSHKVTTIHAKSRNASSLVGLTLPPLLDTELIEIMDERRSQRQVWLWLQAYKNGGSLRQL